MDPNLKPSQRSTLVAAIDPQSASSAKSTGWIDAAKFHNFLAIVSTGVLGSSATVDAKLEQATSSGGAGAKDVTGKAITQLTKANTDDGKKAFIDLKQEDLDFANGFKFVRLTITPAVAASLIAGELLGFDPRYGFAGDNKATSLAQTV